ncbi:aryl-sulfate sulfotransferase [Hymenobacter cheonanensis]|uniref:aryl-sulfate sulfotransferase n=1 Tax=Hymenobacter sp. CA2-7 TaxID=3063993 RepID=UPI0027142EC4|nr:aryl-sulfate sulfotransferase [Hymenobacter sp. CA2-7]MDO7886749.1 aryl-sulfate sulfotransferase [Hymenobacter sp. CA2-7]
MKITYALALGLLALASCHREAAPAPAPVETLHLSFGAGSLTLNPSGYAPLTARLSLTSRQSGRLRLVVHGRHGAASDLTQQFADEGTMHTVPVLGLYPNYANNVTVQLVDPGGAVLADTALLIQTAALPPDMPASLVTTAPTGGPLGGDFTLVSNFSASNPQMPLIVDNYGEVRWLLDYRSLPELEQLSYDCGISRLRNGNFCFGDKTTSQLFEVDVYGTIINRWNMAGYTFHHELYEKPDGNFLVTANKTGSTHPDGTATDEDYVIEINRHANRVVQEWDLKQSLNENRHALEADPVDWLHANAVLYDPSDNTIIVSGRYQGVVKLTYDNHVQWLLAPHRGWGPNHQGQDLKQLLLTPLDAGGQAIADTAVVNGSANAPDFEWNWYQHSVQLMPSGDLLLFDNGTNRNFIRNAPTHYSRAVVYRLDPAARTVQQIWTYGKERGDDTFSAIVSRVQYLPAVNHLLFCPGYQVPNATGQGGKIIELDYASKQVLFEMQLTPANGFAFHRAQRESIYP